MKLMPDVGLTELDLFFRVAKLKSLREGARQVDMTPGAVSKSIKRLESKVGKVLLRRSASGILLTSDGNDLMAFAEKVIRLAAPLVSNPTKKNRLEKVWGIGSLSFLSSRLVPPLLETISSERKNIRFRVVEFGHNQLVAHGLNGAFEMAVHVGLLEWTRVWSTHELGKLKWCLYARSDHPLTKLTNVRGSDVIQFPFVMATGWGAQGFTRGEDHCPAPWGVRYSGHEATTAETALEIVIGTQHLAFVPQILASRSVQSGLISEIKVIDWPTVEKKVYLSVRDDLVSNALLKSVMSLMQNRLEFDVV